MHSVETFLAHSVIKISMAGQKNFVSGNNDSFMLTLILFLDKFSCREDLTYSGWCRMVGGKDLRIVGIGLNNLWETNNLCWIKLHALQSF